MYVVTLGLKKRGVPHDCSHGSLLQDSELMMDPTTGPIVAAGEISSVGSWECGTGKNHRNTFKLERLTGQ